MDLTGNEAPPLVLNADLALLLCARCWGFPTGRPTETFPSKWLAPAWRGRLSGASLATDSIRATEAMAVLRRSQRAQSRAEPGRIHPSWWIRALKDESPAVRKLIASHGPSPVREAAQAAFGPALGELHESPPPSPDVLEWVLSLWTERLVGGEPPSPADRPVILALSSLSARELYRLCHAIGLAKDSPASDPGDVSIRRSGTASLGRGPRRKLALLGLTSIARLLAEAEPHRTRWALQHLPYGIAKRVRSIMAQQTNLTSGQRHADALLLQTSWERLAGRRTGMAGYPDHTLGKAEGGDVD